MELAPWTVVLLAGRLLMGAVSGDFEAGEEQGKIYSSERSLEPGCRVAWKE